MYQVLTNFIEQEYEDSNKVLISVQYAYLALRNELIKSIMLFVYFAILGQQIEYLLCVVALMPLRWHSGGIHMWSNLSCLLFTFVVFNCAINWLPALISASINHMIILLLVSLLLINIIGPLPHLKRWFRTWHNYRRCQQRLLIISLIECILLIAMRNTNYFHCSVWMVLLQLLQLLPIYKTKFKMKPANKKSIEN